MYRWIGLVESEKAALGCAHYSIDRQINAHTNTQTHRYTQMIDLGETEVEEELFNDFLQCVWA